MTNETDWWKLCMDAEKSLQRARREDDTTERLLNLIVAKGQIEAAMAIVERTQVVAK